MKNIIRLSIILFLTFFNLTAKNLKMGIFDTTGIEPYKYQNFIELAKSVDFDVEYQSVSQIADNENLNIENYKIILFIIGIEFLKGINNKSLAALKVLQIMKEANNKNKSIGLALPSIIGNKIKNKLSIFAPILNNLNLNQTKTPINIQQSNYIANSLYIIINNFLNMPLEVKSFGYHTTLSCPRNIKITQAKPVNISFMTTLPIQIQGSLPIQRTLPYGIYWQNPINKNQIFITSSSLLSFCGISENFNLCPVNKKYKLEMLKNVQQMLKELNLILQAQKIDYKQIKDTKTPNLPKKLFSIGKSINKNKIKNNINKITWMDINIFEKEDTESKKQQERLINSILSSGSDLSLWISLNPQLYLSIIAQRKNQKESFFKAVQSFTKQLNLKAKQFKIDPPKILIGFEIAGNLYKPDLPENCPYDIYGNKYHDIPNPIDFNFWDREVLNPLKIFLSEWNKPKINNGIKIEGTVIDLEMYARRSSSNFLDTLGFNQENLNQYGVNNLNDLIAQKKLSNYFNYLEKQATTVGKKIKEKFKRLIPDSHLLFYAPNISTSWFYKGLYRGASTKNNPVQLLTFNSEFNLYNEWLEQNNIFTTHSTVLMLSKIKSPKDLWRISAELKRHNGIWFNKFSHFAKEKIEPNNVEQAQIPKNQLPEFFNAIKAGQ
jgi:hypothetical protein